MVSTLDESEHVYAVRMIKKGIMAHIATTIAIRKLSQSEAADILDLEQPQISLLCNGKDERFSIQHLVRICRAMGTGIDLHFYSIDPQGK